MNRSFTPVRVGRGQSAETAGRPEKAEAACECLAGRRRYRMFMMPLIARVLVVVTSE